MTMATTLLVRGINPVWSYVDLAAHQFDDTFYMWVLENDIPYFPASVWQDPSGNVAWTNPIQFLANGTLPVDIFWDPDIVYRLEFRQHINPLTSPTQADPLIYLVENYVPGSGGSTPISTAGIFTDNQITNPQFADLSFEPPLTLTSVTDQTIEVAPGWTLILTGTGSVTLERLALNSPSLTNPTNAPYALRLHLSAWTSVVLRQRFQQNGMLWTSTPGHVRYVSSSITARIEGAPQFISARLVDSMNVPLTEVLPSTEVNDAFNEYKNFGLMPETTNTDTPPDAYIDYELLLPSNVDIYITSLQLIQSEIPTVFEYEQDSIDRQIDHTWHYYRDSVVMKPKDTILTAWNFSQNPFQFVATALTTVASQTQYIADQTIIHQLAASTVQSGKTGIRNNLKIKALTGTTNNRFALIQYIDPATIMPYWGYLMSALARARIFTTHGSQVGIKMRLIYSTSLPAAISATEPIASWAATDPIFSGSWTSIAPLNDPVYILPNTYSALESGNAFQAFPFDAFEMPDLAGSSTTTTLGVVIYTTANMDSSSGTEDSIEFDRISLVPNEFAIDSNPQTFDEVLRQCQFYYEKSYDQGTLPGAVASGFISNLQNAFSNGVNAIALFGTTINFPFNTVKRTTPSYNVTPSLSDVVLYSPQSGAANTVLGIIQNFGLGFGMGQDIALSNYTLSDIGTKAIQWFGSNGNSLFTATPLVPTANFCAYVDYHYVIDVRLGT